MNLESPETWRWIWLFAAFAFAAAELVTPGMFVFLPFAVGAVLASALAFMGFGSVVCWAVFLVISCAAFAYFWRMGRRFEKKDEQSGAMTGDYEGAEAVVTDAIAAGDVGVARLGREEWRAQSLTGAAIAKGTTVMVTKVEGVRLIVVPVDEPEFGHNARLTGDDEGAI